MKTALCRDLGSMDYKACWELQQRLFDECLACKSSEVEGGRNRADSGFVLDTNPADELEAVNTGTVLLVEHPPVYTLGKSGHAENLLIAKEALEAMGAQFFHIDRGGDITFHGPGQLVCYPVLNLGRIGISLRDYIGALEQAVIRTVAEYGIVAGRIPGASGVWVTAQTMGTGESLRTTGAGEDSANVYQEDVQGNGGISGGKVPRKICAIGVRSSRYVTMHGFALNVSTDLRWFARINPCGFTDRGVTSIAAETGRTAPMDQVKDLVIKFLGEELNVKIYK